MYSQASHQAAAAPAPQAADSYGDLVRLKLASGISNMATGFVEVPKNMINTANNTSSYGGAFDRGGYVLWGITGGGLKGAMHMLGRTIAGVADFATCFIPTQPITNPPFVWQNFYTDTQYGPYYKVESKPGQATPAAGKK
jgi:putative exosortase-associated protein (TIGR04073 family)